jgi:hypothetical protein
MGNPVLAAQGIPDINETLIQGMQFLSQALGQANEVEMKRKQLEQEAAIQERHFKLQMDQLALQEQNFALKQQVQTWKEKQQKTTEDPLVFDQLISSKDFEGANKLIQEKQAQVEMDASMQADYSALKDPNGRALVPAGTEMRAAGLRDLRKELDDVRGRIDRATPTDFMGAMMANSNPQLRQQRDQLTLQERSLRTQIDTVAGKVAADPLLRSMISKRDAAMGKATGVAPTAQAGSAPATATLNGALAAPGTPAPGMVDATGVISPLLEGKVQDTFAQTGPAFTVAATKLRDTYLKMHMSLRPDQRRTAWAQFSDLLNKTTTDKNKIDQIIALFNQR